jgi:transaldolase
LIFDGFRRTLRILFDVDMKLDSLKIKIFGDGADKAAIIELSQSPVIKGFTTNPTLMRKAGVTDYGIFAREVLAAVPDKPFSFEVFADEFDDMERQAHIIAGWGPNVYVKIPITNTRRESSANLVRRLAVAGIQLNVTAVLTLPQVQEIAGALRPDIPAIVSVFAGRIADTGVDPVPIMKQAKAILAPFPDCELLWASPREPLNILHAEEIGADIITVTPDILKKAAMMFGRDLGDLSLDTVKMFYEDGRAAGYVL